MSGPSSPSTRVAASEVVSPFELVFRGRRATTAPLRWGALVAAGIVHVAALGWAIATDQGLEEWSAQLALAVHERAVGAAPVEISIQPPPPSAAPANSPDEPAATPAPAVSPSPAPMKAPRATPARASASAPAPASEAASAPAPVDAGKVVASDEVADFSDASFAVGRASTWVGGASQSGGQGTARTMQTADASPPSTVASTAAAHRPRGSSARPAAMRPGAWRCAWPREARDLPVHQAVVEFRVRIGADGRPRDVKLLKVPEPALGRAAQDCAMQLEFEAALDADGAPVSAWSPVFRVTFTREGGR